MCDSITEAESQAYLDGPRLRRRDVNLGAGATLATLFTGCASQPSPKTPEPTPDPTEAPPELENAESDATEEASAGPRNTQSRGVTVETPDGSAEGFFVTPRAGKRPGVILWPDIAGLREAYRTMATRLAKGGYAVLAVNHYYRSSQLPILETFADWRTDEGRAKIAPMKEAITAEGVARDGAAFVAWLDQQPEVDRARKIGSAGYCMTGSYTFRTAAAAPERVGAIASFHGGGLATADPNSPHLLFSKMKAAALICIAQNDDDREPQAKTTLRQAAEAANIAAEVEVYPAQHGWCCIDSPVYDEAQAERAWARMLRTFEQQL